MTNEPSYQDFYPDTPPPRRFAPAPAEDDTGCASCGTSAAACDSLREPARCCAACLVPSPGAARLGGRHAAATYERFYPSTEETA